MTGDAEQTLRMNAHEPLLAQELRFEFDLQTAARQSTPAISHVRTLGNALHLMQLSPLHQRWSYEDVRRLIIPPLMLRQCRMYMHETQPIAFVSWAYLHPDAAHGYITSTRKLLPQDWNAGLQLWFIDFIAPFGGVPKIVAGLRRGLFANSSAKALRHHGDDRVSRVVEWRGANAGGKYSE